MERLILLPSLLGPELGPLYFDGAPPPLPPPPGGEALLEDSPPLLMSSYMSSICPAVYQAHLSYISSTSSALLKPSSALMLPSWTALGMPVARKTLKNTVFSSVFTTFFQTSYSCCCWRFGPLLGCFLASLELPFGLSWASWAAFWALLGLSWTHLEPCWSILEPVLAPPVPLWAYLGPSLASLSSWVAFCASLGPCFKLPWASLGLFLDSLGPLLVPCWPSCSSFLALQSTLLGPLGLSWASPPSMAARAMYQDF